MVANIALRYPGEWFDLMIALVMGTVLLLFLGFVTGGFCCLWGLIGIIVMLLMVAVANSHLKETSVRVGDETAPVIHSLCMEASKKLGMEMPEVYLDASPEVNAYTRGLVTPVVVLHQGLLDKMDQGELRFVIGHEFGHIKLYHFAIRTMFEPRLLRVPLIVYLPLMVYRLLFLNGRMSRSMEHSADRAGLHACEDINSAVSCMIKLRTGKKEVDRKTVAKAVAGKFEIDEEEGFLSELLSTHPELADRIRELVEYSGNVRIGRPERG
ncbi:MAG: M48 family metallopeptidase [Candidatus Thermoplasmatota archaeon]|nr:M48 family metallopeptidase [Candidatus Thermoplasmatota archaeon]